jgi:glutaredoxin
MNIDVVVYSKNNCVFCDRARMILQRKNISFREMKLDEDFTREHLLEMFPDARTFPVILLDGMYIGGYDQLQTLLESKIDNRKLLNE